MLFKNIMHIAFYTDNMNEMLDYYTNKLGATIKVLSRYKIYANRPDRPQFQKIALETPEKIMNVYLELAPGQYVELFPKIDGQTKNDAKWNEQLGYSHYALTVEDIFETRKILEERGVVFDTTISKGPSETYQMWTHDPDGNMFEIMQYTENSYQVKGHID